MIRKLPELRQQVIVLRDVAEDPDNGNTRYGTAECPRCGETTRFRQDRFPMNYWKMEDQVWRCGACEWAFPGTIGSVAEEPDPGPPVWRDPDLE